MAVSSGYTRTHRAGELYEKELYSRIDDGKGAAPRYMHDLIVHPLNDDGTKKQGIPAPVTQLEESGQGSRSRSELHKPEHRSPVAIHRNMDGRTARRHQRSDRQQRTPPSHVLPGGATQTSKNAPGLRCRIVGLRSGCLHSLKTEEFIPRPRRASRRRGRA